MNKRIIPIAALIAVAVIVVAVAVTALPGDSEKSDSSITVTGTVYLVSDTGTEKHEGRGDSVKEILSSALSDHDLVLKTNGNISSVDSVENSKTRSWTVFRWSSYYNSATGGAWLEYSSQTVFDGMILCVSLSEKATAEDGTVSYEAPDIEVSVKVYFYIRITEQLNSTDWLKSLPLTESQKKEGMWIAGYGSTANEALADAMLTTFFPDSMRTVETGDTEKGAFIDYVVDGKEGFFKYGTSSDMYGWFLSFMGWSDTKSSDEGGEYGTWTYWAQYTYNPSAKSDDDAAYWDYNQLSFGMYDITKYRYFGLVLCTTTTDGVDADIPTPSEIPEGL